VPGREIADVLAEIEVMSPTGARISHLPVGALRLEYRALRGLAPGSALCSALLRVTPSSAQAVREEIARLLERRAATQPLSVPSCGSVFKNPSGDHAGRLIESVGLKGHRVGGAQISPLHANFIANTGGARAEDVCALIREAQRRVYAASGIHLEPEVHVVGSRG
jgi:UDP-N-acetylmuramate dehydrogenase